MSAPPKSSRQLIEENQGLVRSLARRIHRGLPPHVELDDLVAYGELGLVEAANGFDASRGHQFSTFAYYRIRGAIYDGLSKMNWYNRSQYQAARNEQLSGEVLALEGEQNETAPAESFEDDARWLKRTAGSLGVVYLMTHRSDEEGDRETALVDASTPTPAAVVSRRETNEKLIASIDTLSEEAASLIRAVYFEGLTLQDAGKRIGVSKAWASRLHAKSLEQLARSLRRAGVSDAE
jgi:RNA polymerase sigma factor for flagellar operon FliA